MLSKSTSVWGGALVVAASASAASAGQLTVDIQLPQQSVAEYHKPYVAGWIEDSTGQAKATVFVWYDVKKRDGGGLKYLKELRTWWRKAGRDLSLPAGRRGLRRPLHQRGLYGRALLGDRGRHG